MDVYTYNLNPFLTISLLYYYIDYFGMAKYKSLFPIFSVFNVSNAITQLLFICLFVCF